MSDTTTQRIGIIASIITILGAIWYFIGGRSNLPATVVSAGGSLLPAGSPALFNIPGTGMIAAGPAGPAGPAGTPGTPGADGSPGPIGLSGTADLVYPGGPAYAFPTSESLPSNDSVLLPAYLRSNLPPTMDLPKEYARLMSGGSPDTAGCKCGGGCKKSCCNNEANSARFWDGTGNCLSSTVATLARAQNECVPGTLQSQYDNMLTNRQFWGRTLSDNLEYVN